MNEYNKQVLTVLSVVQSRRLQGCSVITFFQQALQAKVGHCSCPSLVPQVGI